MSRFRAGLPWYGDRRWHIGRGEGGTELAVARTQNKRSIIRPPPRKNKRNGKQARQTRGHAPQVWCGPVLPGDTMRSPVLHTHPFTSRFRALTECEGASVEMCHAVWGGANIYKQAIRRVRPPTDVGTCNTSAPRRPQEGETESENYQPNELSGSMYSNPQKIKTQVNAITTRVPR